MNSKEIIEINKIGWDNLIKSNKKIFHIYLKKCQNMLLL